MLRRRHTSYRSSRPDEEVQGVREACVVAATVLDKLCKMVASGVCTYDIDLAGKKLIADMGAQSACYNYQAENKIYPAHTCLSVNDEVVHGIGKLDVVLKEGDNITVDVCVKYKGFVGDNARTLVIGEASEEMKLLVDRTREALDLGIAQARAGNRVGDISHAVQSFVEGHGYSVVRNFVGHGVGRSMHEDPQIPNFGRKKSGAKLYPGMTLAIEPMVLAGRHEIDIDDDQWTARTRDRKPAAHFEHIVLVTEDEPEILTIPEK
ncbi:type I methionyl aminopeptidase [Cerasicoccus arenae]|uniref:Methionine aminopeptidase n=1 Tax=Cerasicoccus arenae TaxID=424488 RepID=A0A8J3GFW1_9BACT|nr:type I methionyl aminopeptidase [Cerasicoccus arenae]MBK1857350.1 type I methionyl aminopeptidase [Cerasicoccus arenae]GHC08923.1 methionine aminopeptidase [Cerasicoccus arenae]